MQMTSSSPAYLLPGPSSTTVSKSTLIKHTLPPSSTVPATLPSVHHVAHHQIQHPLHRPSISSHHSHQQFSRTPSNNDTFHSLTVANTNNGNSLLMTNNNNNNSNTPSLLTNNNGDDNSGGSGSGGHSLSHSMESINNIGFTDDEVSKIKYARFLLLTNN